MVEDLRICTKCGIVFDLKFRPNKDCPHAIVENIYRQNEPQLTAAMNITDSLKETTQHGPVLQYVLADLYS